MKKNTAAKFCGFIINRPRLVWFWFKKHAWKIVRTQIIILIGLVILGVDAVIATRVWATQAPLIARDIALASLANAKAGERIPLPEDADYTWSELYARDSTWLISTNSKFLLNELLRAAPFMEYELITNDVTLPRLSAFVPLAGAESLHVLGWALPGRAALLNARLATSSKGGDWRVVKSTLVHELIHNQSGAFISGPSASFESRTQAATIEVLAAMCQYGDDVACASFWQEIYGAALSDLWIRVGRENANFIANLLWRNADQEAASAKADRYWARNRDRQRDIIDKYGRSPLVDHVFPGLCGYDMDTGHYVAWVIESTKPPVPVQMYMPFDDTRVMFGDLFSNILCNLVLYHPLSGFDAEQSE